MAQCLKKKKTCLPMQETVGLIPGSGRSPGEGSGSPHWYSCLGNPMNRGAWQATVHGVAKDLVTKQQQQCNIWQNVQTL